jgi:uncharacterized membrane protein
MRKNLFWLEILLLLLAGISATASTNLHNPLFASAGLLCFSLFVFVAGGDALVSRKVGFFPKNPNFGRTETYQGFTATLLGSIFIFLGICFLVVAIFNLTLKGGMEELWSKLLGSYWGWSIVLVCIGLVVLFMGIIRLIAGSGGYYKGWQDRVERITGILPTIFGLALVILGVFLFLFPGPLINLFNQIVNQFK